MRQPQGLELYPRMPVTGMRPKGAAVAGVAPGDKSERPARPQELSRFPDHGRIVLTQIVQGRLRFLRADLLPRFFLIEPQRFGVTAAKAV